jgi:hypothetical protein
LAAVAALIVAGVLGVVWFGTNVLGWAICPCG